jgi:hypothetical protein
MSRRHITTQEEKVAKQLGNLLSDVRLDLDLVGIYLADLSPNVVYRRLQLIAEQAEHQKEMRDVRNQHNPLF